MNLISIFKPLLPFFIFIAAILIAIVVLGTIISFFKPKKKWPYLKKESLLTPAEQKFFFVLREILMGSYLIFSKVRMEDVLYLPNGMNYNENTSYRNRIKSRHVDFLICDKNSTKPLLAIELDDSSHLLTERIERDDFVDEIFKQANMPILHIKASSNYNKDNLKSQIGSYLS